jgi:hypothetical protein
MDGVLNIQEFKMKIVFCSLLALVLMSLVFISGCTNAGPFVTDIAFDGEGNLLVTKNTAQFNWFFGTISSGENEQTIIIKMPKAYKTDEALSGYKANIDPKTGKYVTSPVYEQNR